MRAHRRESRPRIFTGARVQSKGRDCAGAPQTQPDRPRTRTGGEGQAEAERARAIEGRGEEVLWEALAALADVARKKLPDDEEIAAMASAADTILQTTKDQRNMVRQFEELLKP